MADRAEAQRKADRIRGLREELSAPDIAEVLQLTDIQRERFDCWANTSLHSLEQQFDVDISAVQGSMSWGMRIASALCGVAFSASLVLFFQHYWGNLDILPQVLFVSAAPLALLFATEFAAKRERTLYFAGLLSLIALAAFVLNLSVLGQIFNIAPSERAFLAWGLFALILAYRYRQRIQLTIAIILLLTWACSALTAAMGHHWLDLGNRPENACLLGVAVWSVPFAIRHRQNPSFDMVYRVLGMLAFFIAITGLSEGEMVSYLPFDTNVTQAIYEILGIAAAAASIWQGVRRQWATQANLGAAFFCFLLVSRFYHWWWASMPAWLFFAIMGLFGAGVVVALKYMRRQA